MLISSDPPGSRCEYRVRSARDLLGVTPVKYKGGREQESSRGAAD